MKVKKIFPAAVKWTDEDPPSGTEIALCLGGSGDPDCRAQSFPLVTPSNRGLSLMISCHGRQIRSKDRFINLVAMGVENVGDGSATEDELEAILEKVRHIELHRTPDADIRAEIFFCDDGTERFFIEEGAHIFSVDLASAK